MNTTALELIKFFPDLFLVSLATVDALVEYQGELL